MNRSGGPVVRSERSVTCCEHTDDQKEGTFEGQNLIIFGSHHYNNMHFVAYWPMYMRAI